jgi:hypothetical protein
MRKFMDVVVFCFEERIKKVEKLDFIKKGFGMAFCNMKNALGTIQNVFRRTFLYDVILQILWRREARCWEKNGKPIPPPHLVKQRAVKEYAAKFSARTLIETGTYHGDMVNATKYIFDKIFSVELDKTLYEQAKKKFAKFDRISIMQGDSGEVLPHILAEALPPCLFWLDAHYSGGQTAKGDIDTPVMEELRLIFDQTPGEPAILIDDARLFVGHNDYPTMEQLRSFVFKRRPDYVIEVENDIIKIHKKSAV